MLFLINYLSFLHSSSFCLSLLCLPLFQHSFSFTPAHSFLLFFPFFSLLCLCSTFSLIIYVSSLALIVSHFSLLPLNVPVSSFLSPCLLLLAPLLYSLFCCLSSLSAFFFCLCTLVRYLPFPYFRSLSFFHLVYLFCLSTNKLQAAIQFGISCDVGR